ncbi:DMT family transporter [Schinkia azotoformans]|uniref:Putative transporter n=1 Tax=Schinkia azotoformans LMG 9581 TaxID=1131731 RepID=K6C9Z9_SCHAZ|nr:DMT family transporter [Schinkia azotoformans]EKN67955.1 putative transporter [Schinkia azotoformans LMG 9581]MEC1637025.1 DMT family transporter [Schinkia azotoformans]MEC1947009.1 DMT family transporter [Schinkia azotoformans]
MKGQVKLIAAMLIFGSLGIFVKNINLSSSEIALFRGAIGSIFLICASFLVKQKLSFKAIKRNGILLILSGAAIGFNWIFLFEAYRFTTISNATISYYFAPVFVMALAPMILKEKLTASKVSSIIGAMIGLFLVVNNGTGSASGSYNHTVGILYGLSAAALYASVILMNKFIKKLSGFETTLIQLMLASLVLVPYVYWQEGITYVTELGLQSIVFILILGIVHTGFAYYLYFGSIKELKGHTIAILSYIDPISAVIFAAIFFSESMSLLQIIGGVLVLGSTFIGGMGTSKKRKRVRGDEKQSKQRGE